MFFSCLWVRLPELCRYLSVERDLHSSLTDYACDYADGFLLGVQDRTLLYVKLEVGGEVSLLHSVYEAFGATHSVFLVEKGYDD